MLHALLFGLSLMPGRAPSPARRRPVSMTATLGDKDVAELLSRFSPSKDGQVDWAMFLAWGHPPIKVAHAVTMIREYADDRRVADSDAVRATDRDHSPSEGGRILQVKSVSTKDTIEIMK